MLIFLTEVVKAYVTVVDTVVTVCLLYLTGTQNYSGLSVFSVVPIEGSIAPGQSQNITVTFQPDHPSVYYSDRLTIELMNKVSRGHTHTKTAP